MADLDESISKMIYIATGKEQDLIEDEKDEQKKKKLFREFWKSKDPTPNTERNEAMEEYYLRIEYANRTFRSAGQGWQSDMGMVYVIFGQPDKAEQVTGYSTTRVYEKWRYFNYGEIIFVDNSGFGDYRLYQPIAITEKYQYVR
jgi:GWxTD domain-containing protein